MIVWFKYLIDSIVNIVGHVMLDIREIAWDFYLLTFSKSIEISGWFNSFIVSRLPDFDPSSHWAKLPADAIKLLNYLHFGQCLTIVIVAMVTRFTLDFVARLGKSISGSSIT